MTGRVVSEPKEPESRMPLVPLPEPELPAREVKVPLLKVRSAAVLLLLVKVLLDRLMELVEVI